MQLAPTGSQKSKYYIDNSWNQRQITIYIKCEGYILKSLCLVFHQINCNHTKLYKQKLEWHNHLLPWKKSDIVIKKNKIKIIVLDSNSNNKTLERWRIFYLFFLFLVISHILNFIIAYKKTNQKNITSNEQMIDVRLIKRWLRP